MEQSSSSPRESEEEAERQAGQTEDRSQEPRKRSGSGARKSVEFADPVEERSFDEDEEEHYDSDYNINDEANYDEDDEMNEKNMMENDNEIMDDMKNNFDADSDSNDSELDIEDKQDIEESSSGASSVALDKTNAFGKTHPRIARGFRPEIMDDRYPSSKGDSRTSKRSVSFTPKPPSEMSKSKSLAVRETSQRKTYDGREITMVTLDTQTDWDWFDSAVESGEGRLLPQDDEDSRDKEKSDLKSILVKPDSREAVSQARTEMSEPVSVDDVTAAHTPYTPYSDEFGIPILQYSSDSDSSDDDSPRRSQEDHNFLPSIGPPQILQYVRESEKNAIDVEDPEKRQDGEDKPDFPVDEFDHACGMFGGKCEFCHNDIKPFPSVDRQKNLPPSELYCCEEYREFVHFATTTAMGLEEETRNAQKLINVKPHAHFGTKHDRKAAKERAVQRMRERELHRRQQEASGLQNYFSLATVGGPVGAGAAAGSKGHHTAGKSSAFAGGSNVPFKDFASSSRSTGLISNEVARQMKTINYQLSSQRCWEEGWTLRPPSPLENEEDDMDVFVPEPLGSHRERPLIRKFYDDGKKFLIIFPDGSGNIFYPSGQVAVTISPVAWGQYLYIVHDNTPERNVQAVFEPNGYGSCYHNNGIVRLYFDQFGGIELDSHGGKKRKWSWKDPETHVHAPPFQPICLGMNRYLALRVMSQENIALTFTARKRSCRFNVGSRLKLVAPENIPPKEIDDSVLFLDETKIHVETILDKVTTLLKFPRSPKLDKILPPIHVTSKMQRTEKMRQERASSRLEKTNSKSGRMKHLPVVKVN